MATLGGPDVVKTTLRATGNRLGPFFEIREIPEKLAFRAIVATPLSSTTKISGIVDLNKLEPFLYI